MRIGYLYDLQVYPPRGGNHRHVIELVEGFLAAGHRVHVVDDPTMPGVVNYDSHPSALQDFIENIDILYVRIDARFIRRWAVLNQCMRYLAGQPVVWEINSPASENIAYSWLGGKLEAGSRQENVVSYLRRWFHAARQKPGIWLEERCRRRLAKQVSTAICVSDAVGKYARNDLGITDVLVLPNGGPLIGEAEIMQRRERRQHNRFTVLYSGSAIYPWQGLNFLIQVIELAAVKAPDITFVLAVNQNIAGLQQADNVVILEGLNQEEVRNAICAADVCVALVPEWPWAKYGFHLSPIKLFEYMAFMVPVLTSNHSQMRDVIKDGEDGYLTENDPVSILDKIISIRNNPAEAEKVARQAWMKIQTEYNWPHNVSETLGVFERACSAR